MNAPDRVTADLRRYQREQDRLEQHWQDFDPLCEEHVAAVVPFELVKPIASLFSLRAQGFGSEEIEALYRGCKSRWEDL